MRKEPFPLLPDSQETEVSPDLLSDNGVEINRSDEIFSELSERYEIPIEDVRYMDLNRTGICLPGAEVWPSANGHQRPRVADGHRWSHGRR